MYKLGSDEEVRPFLSDSRKKGDATYCNCTSNLKPGGKIAVDHSQDMRMKILFYDGSTSSIMATDINGCFCRTIVTQDKVKNIGIWLDIKKGKGSLRPIFGPRIWL